MIYVYTVQTQRYPCLSIDAIKFLLENGASSEQTTGKGYTLMTLARGQGNSDVVRFLKQKLGIVNGYLPTPTNLMDI